MSDRMKAYRLPAELGGGTIVAESGGYAAGQHSYIGAIIPGVGRVDLSIARPLEEVRPPSIDDPVTLPVRLVCAAPPSEDPMPVHIDEAQRNGYVAYLRVGVRDSAWLRRADALDAARALWRLAMDDGVIS